MANFFFDGTANVTAAKADNVLITANPALFTSQAQSGSNVVFTYNNGTTLTVTGTTLGDSATNLPGVQLASGTFSTGNTAGLTATTQNDLVFAPNAGGNLIDVSGGGTASSIKAVFGGNGVSDSADTADAIQIGGKGSFLVYGNAGADAITQASGTTGAFDSSSFVTVFGGKNDINGLQSDSITLANTGNLNAKFAVYGGEGTDSINIFNTGANANTAIFGGQGAADSADSADTITFNGGGTVNIFSNAGNDSVTLGAVNTGTAGVGGFVANGIDSTGNVTIHGGLGGDTVTVNVSGTTNAGETKINVVVFGDQNDSTTGNDVLTVGGNAGTTTIYGGTAAADSADGADTINFSGQGTTNIFAGGGNDAVVVNTTGTNLLATGLTAGTGNAVAVNGTSTNNVFLGNGNDSIVVLNSSTNTGVTTIAGGAGNDQFTIGSTTAGVNGDGVVAGTTVGAGLAGTGLSVVISDFGNGFDSLQINNNFANTNRAATVATTPSGGFTSLQQALDAAANVNAVGSAQGTAAQGTVGVATFGNDTYVVLNNSGTGFDASVDLAVKLTGVTSASAVAALTTII